MVELTVRIVVSLVVVLGLLWGLAKLARRPLAGRGGGMLTVLARQQLTRGSSIAVVRIADRALVLGVTEAGVTLLADAEAEVFDDYRAEPAVRRVPVALPAALQVEVAATLPVEVAATPGRDRRLGGSALSPATWIQAASYLRGRLERRP